jgi:hypothetical protein
VSGRIEEHSDVLLRLMIRDGRTERDGVRHSTLEVADLESRCIMGRCSRSTGGQTGGR